nr:unnamed protein product [Digitaria exilis]
MRMFFRHLLPACILLLLLMSHLPSSIFGLRTLREVRTDLRRHEHEIPPTISPPQKVGDGATAATASSKYAVSRRTV